MLSGGNESWPGARQKHRPPHTYPLAPLLDEGLLDVSDTGRLTVCEGDGCIEGIPVKFLSPFFRREEGLRRAQSTLYQMYYGYREDV